MKIYTASEEELDQRLALDKRRDARAFYTYYLLDEELPAGYLDLQDKIRDGLEQEYWRNFDDGIDRSQLETFGLAAMHSQFFFPAEPLPCELITIEMSHELLCDKLLGIIVSYLEKCPSSYCVTTAIFRGGLKGTNYLGRFVINRDEVAVEAALSDIWRRQIKFMELEDRK